MSKPFFSDMRGPFHSAMSAASGYSTSSISRILRQILQVYFLFLVSFFTRLDAISTRKPSQPMSSQNRMTSFMASTVATQAGPSVGFCHFSLIFP